ncbi:MAG: FtsX-like permease family [Candidatus Tokpelaia hoelldobleri]|uniref:FtsX-like permease family n=1 Tax=Candidatus Tokpelaia hoelldobleri TaxID=1902579 RepID=A0A1U9JWJ3_9HYPH|nr:MAG: FtsX-like permease family [Candidatus Tokpelaia hoelldoblerii]
MIKRPGNKKTARRSRTARPRAAVSAQSASPPRPSSIVPQGGVRGQALVVVIAIMTFLAALALGETNLVSNAARNWQNDISSEATVQIVPVDGVDMEQTLSRAAKLVAGFDTVAAARILSLDQTEKLLEPWLGSDIDIAGFPVPRLVTVTWKDGAVPDFAAIRDTIESTVPGASFDDHRIWTSQLASMAWVSVAVRLAVFVLVLAALIMTVVFATRSALSDNHHVVEVLHFIGADGPFIARQFDRYFFRTGFKGAAIGGLCAVVLFWALSLWLSGAGQPAQGSQLALLFGHFSTGWSSLAEIFVLVIFVSVLAMMTSRYTVIRNLRDIDRKGADFLL